MSDVEKVRESSSPGYSQKPTQALGAVTRWEMLKLVICRPFWILLSCISIEAMLSGATTWLIIHAGQDMSQGQFSVVDFAWILLAQSVMYVVGASSWVFAERAGFGAFGRYVLRFARTNRDRTGLLNNQAAREHNEPFLTGEAFHVYFELMYEIELDLRLGLGLFFNAAVLGFEVDAGLPIAYAVILVFMLFMQWWLRRPIARAYLTDQRKSNRLTAQTYTMWDSVFTGNRYNFRLWHHGFKQRLRDALGAKIRAILAREGLSSFNGIIGLAVVFSVMAWIAHADIGNTMLLIALATTLPRQIEMTHDVHTLANGWNDFLALLTRMRGIAEGFFPESEHSTSDLTRRIDFDRIELSVHNPLATAKDGIQGEALGDWLPLRCADLDGAVGVIRAQRFGRVLLRGGNGAGKSTLLTALKERLGGDAYYWPTNDRLSFVALRVDEKKHLDAGLDTTDEDFDEDDEDELDEAALLKQSVALPKGFSAGQRQLVALQEIEAHTHAKIYLLDEWDANLDDTNRDKAEQLIDRIAQRARVIEISHRKAKME